MLQRRASGGGRSRSAFTRPASRTHNSRWRVCAPSCRRPQTNPKTAMLNEMQPEPADGRRPEKTTMISRKLTRRLEELEARRQVKKPLRVVVRYVDGASDSSDPPQPEDDSHEIIQVVVEYVDLPAKAPQNWAEQFARATFTGGRGPGLATDNGK